MNQLFAPWRIEWVTREDKNSEFDGCPFCALPDLDDARESRVVAESERSYVLLNNYPYNPGHVMVIPREHTGDFRDLDDETLLEHGRLKQRTIDALYDGLNAEGINAGLNLGRAAGGSIGDHVHTHLVPRWVGDTNFMPICSDTKVIVQAVDDTYDALHDAFADQDGATVTDEHTPVGLEF